MSSFFTLGAENRLGKSNRLTQLNKLINWAPMKALLTGFHKNEINSQGGPKAYNNLSMFKALLLGQWHSLSDPGLEEALRVRLDFMFFTGFELEDNTPDETTLCRFRNKLIAKGLHTQLFEEINLQLENHGIKVKEAEAALVDATIIRSAARPRKTIEADNRVTQSADQDASWVKKGKHSFFGYRGYFVADNREGFIHHIQVKPANESEVSQLPYIIPHTHGKRLFTDKGFTSHNNRCHLKARGIQDGLSYKASRGHPLKWSQRLFNKIVAKRRFRIEQAFGTLKRKFGMTRASYFSRLKVEGQLYFKALCFNLNKALRMVTIT